MFPDSGSEPEFEGLHASEPAGNLSSGDDSGSEAVTESDDEGVTGRLSDAEVAAACRTNPHPPDFIHPHGPLIHASGSYELYWTTIEYIALADAFHSLPQVPVGSGVQEARPASKQQH